MRFDITETSTGTVVFLKEHWYKPAELIGMFPVRTHVILEGIKHLLIKCGSSPEEADKVISSAKFTPTPGDQVLDIRKKSEGVYAIRKLHWFLRIKYYRTFLLVEAQNEDEVIKALIESFPDHIAIRPLTGEPYTY